MPEAFVVQTIALKLRRLVLVEVLVMNKFVTRSLAFAATLSLGAVCASGAQAEVVRVLTRPAVIPVQSTVVVPSAVVRPGYTVTTTKRTFTPAPPATVTTRTYELPAVVREVRTVPVPTTTTLIGPESVVVPGATSSFSSETVVSESKVSQPDPMGRLRAMNEQISLGVSKGMLTGAAESGLRAEASRLESLISADLVGGLTTEENNDLERQLTVFQQQIAEAMK